MTIDRRVALVSGASRGIGSAVAQELAKRGFYVVGTATTSEGAQRISQTLSSNGEGVVLDVCNNQNIESLVKDLFEKHKHIDALVNNAGITRDNLALRMSQEDWHSVINTNLSAVFALTQACIKPMVKSRYGRIVNITSVVGAAGNAGQANYCAAKAGVVGMTKSLAHELGSRGITVNCVAPGFIETDMTASLNEEHRKVLSKKIPLGRFGSVNDIAHAVAFLTSEEAGYISGSTLHVNGGMYMS
jgi:3-oxoacyl-[acyl-carrier protein] reductase